VAVGLIGSAAWHANGLDAAADGASTACPPSRAKVLSASRTGVAYSIRYTLYGCYRPTGRKFLIGDLSSDPNPPSSSTSGSVDHPRVAGHFMAWADTLQRTTLETEHHVLRVDLRSGKRLRGEPTGTSPCPDPQTFCGSVGIGPVSRLVIDDRASIGWIAANDSTAEVWRVDSRGRKRLAAGSDIDRKSLKRHGHTIEWRQGGTSHSASLRP
jgi:hypothetical protein